MGAPERQIAVVVNPSKRGAQRAVGLIRRAVGDIHPHTRLQILPTTPGDPGTGQTERAVAAGCDLVVVVGGDGTVRLVADRLAGTEVALGIVAVGTANLAARNLGLYPAPLTRAVATALHGRLARIDLGQATVLRNDVARREPFLVLAGIGHDAAAVAAVRRRLKSGIGWLAYFEAGLRHLTRKAIDVEISVDDGVPVQVPAWTVLAGNLRSIPGRVVLFPDAVADNGLLQILIASPNNSWAWGRIGFGGLTGRHHRTPELSYQSATTVRITPQRPCTAQFDGDAVEQVEQLTARILPQALSVRVGRRIQIPMTTGTIMGRRR